jgi:hypothetical protein
MIMDKTPPNNDLMGGDRFPEHFVCAGIAFSAFILGACSHSADETIGAESKRIISLKPLLEQSEEPWPTHPSEKVAIQFLNALAAQDPSSAEQIKSCAAQSNPISEKCQTGESYDAECSIKRGYWKGFVAKHLHAATIDLNGDDIPDYIIRGDMCSGLFHNYTWETFVLLSRKSHPHHLALSTNANHFDVMPLSKLGGQVIVEGISSYNGESLNIHVLQNGKYVPEACFYRDRSEIEQGRDLRNANCASPDNAGTPAR